MYVLLKALSTLANKEHIQELIKKFISNTCSEKERKLLFHYIQRSDNDELLKDIIDQEFFNLSDGKLPEKESDHLYEKISKGINRKDKFSIYSVYKIAASLIIVLISALIFLHFNVRKITYTTAYGEVMKIQLPDNSSVILNANSSIEFKKDGFAKNDRELWLKGEAFFNIRTLNGKAFIVYAEGMNVEVLGTQFNIKSRRGNTNVFLREGKVKLNHQKINKEITLLPGEMAEYKEDKQMINTKKAKSENYLSWIDNKLMFDRMTLSEIAAILNDNYGLQVVFDHESFGKLVFTGSTPADNLDILFGSIEKLFGLVIEKKNDKIIIKKLPEPSDRSR